MKLNCIASVLLCKYFLRHGEQTSLSSKNCQEEKNSFNASGLQSRGLQLQFETPSIAHWEPHFELNALPILFTMISGHQAWRETTESETGCSTPQVVLYWCQELSRGQSSWPRLEEHQGTTVTTIQRQDESKATQPQREKACDSGH